MSIGWIGRYSLVLILVLVISMILSVGVPLFFGRRVVESRSAKYLGGSVGIFIMCGRIVWLLLRSTDWERSRWSLEKIVGLFELV